MWLTIWFHLSMTFNTSYWWRARPLQVQVAACRLGSARPGFQMEGSCLWVYSQPSLQNYYVGIVSVNLAVKDSSSQQKYIHLPKEMPEHWTCRVWSSPASRSLSRTAASRGRGWGVRVFFSEDDVDMLKKITTGSITFGLVLKNSSQYITNRKSKINFNFRSKHNLSFRYLDITAPLLLYLRFVQLFSLSLFCPMWYAK